MLYIPNSVCLVIMKFPNRPANQFDGTPLHSPIVGMTSCVHVKEKLPRVVMLKEKHTL